MFSFKSEKWQEGLLWPFLFNIVLQALTSARVVKIIKAVCSGK
jgi:hypothetical protein